MKVSFKGFILYINFTKINMDIRHKINKITGTFLDSKLEMNLK